jgi:hypothetical protein
MSKNTAVTGKLKIGDIIHIGNPLLSEKDCYYRVTAIDGNKAKTGFRIFNRNIYHNGIIYEYGKRQSSVYDNYYTVSSEEAARIAGASIL